MELVAHEGELVLVGLGANDVLELAACDRQLRLEGVNLRLQVMLGRAIEHRRGGGRLQLGIAHLDVVHDERLL